MENREELLEKIKAQGDVVRNLKADKAEKSMVRLCNCKFERPENV